MCAAIWPPRRGQWLLVRHREGHQTGHQDGDAWITPGTSSFSLASAQTRRLSRQLLKHSHLHVAAPSLAGSPAPGLRAPGKAVHVGPLPCPGEAAVWPFAVGASFPATSCDCALGRARQVPSETLLNRARR